MLSAFVWPIVRRYWGVALAVILAGWVMAACHQRDEALVAKGHAEEKSIQLAAHLAVLELKAAQDSARADSLERAARVDTLRFTRWRTKYDTARVAVDIHDTTSVKQFIATTDGTVRQCTETVLTLVSSCAAKDTLINDLRTINASLRAAVPAAVPDRRFSLGITVGYGATVFRDTRDSSRTWRVVAGPSATVGGSLRLW